MKGITKIILCLIILFLIIGVVSAAGLKDTSEVKVDSNALKIGGKTVATIDEYPSSDCIDEKILSYDSDAVIKHVTENGAEEVTSVDNPDDVYEFLTTEGFYYTFGKDGKTYIVTINENVWDISMLKQMDTWCLQNSK